MVYDVATGKQVWKFYTVPGPDDFVHDTWAGDSWEHGSAARVADRARGLAPGR